MIIPARMNIKPLIVQEGLLYINELGGPNSDWDCAVKIKPAITSMNPIISTSIFIYYQIKRITSLPPNTEMKYYYI